MLIHLDTSVLVDAFTGSGRALHDVARATDAGHVLTFCSLVHYEWRRGPRAEREEQAVLRFFGTEGIVAFGTTEAQTAATLYRRVKRARQRQADLAIAACALEHHARFWTLNTQDFDDVPGLALYRP